MGGRAGWWRRADDTGIPLLVARVVLAAMFIYMGVSKVLDPIDFLKLIREYHILPEVPPHFLNLAAVILPPLEVVCGLALLVGVAVRGAAVTLFGMLWIFTTAVIIRSLSLHATGVGPYCSIRFDCGCGGGEVYICWKLLENSGLILLSALAMLSRSRRFCLSNLLQPGSDRAVVAS